MAHLDQHTTNNLLIAAGAGAAGIAIGAGLTHFLARHKEETYVFSSESVCEGHPDKLCDQVSDAILDACLRDDPNSKVACNVSAKGNFIIVYGEITTSAKIDIEAIVKDVVKNIGYDDIRKGMDYKSVEVQVRLMQQSADIAQGVHVNKRPEDVGAGDQGMMFGYATDETPELMPITSNLANRLCEKLCEVRKNKTVPYLRPDGKSQVTVEYHKRGGVLTPVRVHTVVISAQHDDHIALTQIKADLMEHVIRPVIPARLLDKDTKYFLQPSGRFVIGGSAGDSGLTGRKIIIDTYGGWGAHGGGAFSGKDPTKVDRSGAYIARQAAKSLVAAKLCTRVLVQIAYAIGIPQPMSVCVDTFGTGAKSDEEICRILKENFDFRPGMIMQALQLKQPMYQKTATYGHFGRVVKQGEDGFTWEVVVPLKY